jgi:uncharacterized DUF497 family protein
MRFRWNQWNADHIQEHGINAEEAEYVLRNAHSPFPRYDGDGKYRVWGQTAHGEFLQVIFIYDPPGVVFVIHARPLSRHEKSLFRRKRK